MRLADLVRRAKQFDPTLPHPEGNGNTGCTIARMYDNLDFIRGVAPFAAKTLDFRMSDSGT
jgi:hypothetical protein